MSATHHLVRNNALLPYSCNIPGKGLYLLQYPHSLDKAKQIILELLSSSSQKMCQCVTCHWFITGAPDPSCDHTEGASGPLCVLPHHPPPCPRVDKHGNPCTYHAIAESAAAALAAHVPDSAPGPGSSHGTPEDVTLLRQQLEDLQRERDEEKRRAEMLQVANSNLQDSHQRLSRQIAFDRPSISFPAMPATTSFTTFPTTTTTSLNVAPRTGIGYSSSIYTQRTAPYSSAHTPSHTSASVSLLTGFLPSHPHPHVSATGPGGGGVLLSSLAGAASSHVLRNSVSAGETPHSVDGSTGPTIPQLRGDPEASDMAQRVMGLLLREIPALASLPSAPAQSAPTPPATSAARLPPMAASYPPPVSVYCPLSSSQDLLGGAFPSHHVDPRHSRLDLLQQQLDEIRLQVEAPKPQDRGSAPDTAPVSLDSFTSCTIKCKQFRAVDFAKMGTFQNTSQIKHKFKAFSYGSLRHLLYIIDGTLPSVSQSELCSRIKHLINTFDIVSLSSSITDFDNNAWKMGKHKAMEKFR